MSEANTENAGKTRDVIVVGAGPAGCAAAFDLCRAGQTVLLLDRHQFPRVKPCGGGLTVKTLKALRYSVRPCIGQVCCQMRVSNNLEESSLFTSPYPLCAMTTRMEFDSYCLQKTIESGAVLQKVQHLWEIHEDAAGVTLTAGEGRFRGKFLIGADGASGQIGRLIRFTPAPKALAIEGRVYLKGAFQEMLLDFGVVDSGYGWVFPKKDHLSVGLYTMSEEVSLRRESLADYAHRRLGPCDLVDMVGHAIGLGGWKYRPSSQRVFLVGDAAGLAEALLGEGIYHAIISGQSAARAINQQLRTGESARRCFRKLLGPIQRAAWSEFRLARWFYGDLAFGYSLLTCPLTRYALTKGYALGWTHRAIRHYGWLLPFQKVLKLDEMLPA